MHFNASFLGSFSKGYTDRSAFTACYNTATIAIVPTIIIAGTSDTATDTTGHAALVNTERE